MEIIGTQLISAPREAVWLALNDPLILKNCLPGCESVEKLSNEEFKVIIKTSIGPLRARFQGSLIMTESHPPASCVMNFEGQGGAVGFGKGTSSVTLESVAEGTQLSYNAKAQIGGKLAQVGSRLIDSVAKKMTDDFFKAFKAQLQGPDVEPSIKNALASQGLAPSRGHAVSLSTEVAHPPSVAQVTPPAPANAEAAGHAHQASHAAHTAHTAPTPLNHEEREHMVPAWWLAPACVLGAAIAIAARLIN